MARTLVIVESPAKAKTLTRFLGRDVVVKASVGHVRDLPKSSPGLGEGYEPNYEVLEATLVRALEENGIGRPSTYATIIATISGRDYVSKDCGHVEPAPPEGKPGGSGA